MQATNEEKDVMFVTRKKVKELASGDLKMELTDRGADMLLALINEFNLWASKVKLVKKKEK